MAEMGCDQISGQGLTGVLSQVLTRLIAVNEKNSGAVHNTITKFHAQRAPSISVSDYLERIRRFSNCSDECFVIALIYIDRLIESKNFVLSHLNVHRIVITSVLVAAKFFDDHFYNNAYYARVGGVPCTEMNSLELEFLLCTDYRLFVSEDVYEKYRRELAHYAQSAVVPRKSVPSYEGVYAQEHETVQKSMSYSHVPEYLMHHQQKQQRQTHQQQPLQVQQQHHQHHHSLHQSHEVTPEMATPYRFNVPQTRTVYPSSGPAAAPQLAWSYSYPNYGEFATNTAAPCAGNMQSHAHYMQIPVHSQCPHDPMADGPILMMQTAPPPLFHQSSYPFGPPQPSFMEMHGRTMYTQPTFYVPVGSL